jgi:hypothetical protein
MFQIHSVILNIFASVGMQNYILHLWKWSKIPESDARNFINAVVRKIEKINMERLLIICSQFSHNIEECISEYNFSNFVSKHFKSSLFSYMLHVKQIIETDVAQ